MTKQSATRDSQHKSGKRKPPRTAWKPGESGNPAGRPEGSKHKATLAAEALLDGEAEALTRKAIERALGGDSTALRLCLERLVPPRRDRSIQVDLPEVVTASDAVAGKTALLRAVAEGTLSPTEAQTLSVLIDGFCRTLETAEFEERLARIEEHMDSQRGNR
ncbi:MAG TPA: hypothetical protein ENH10_02495 [Bacteroidetes bacterium]|nr:hypothetical protein [Bacteroidota bacterium]HEX04009.1 hypothetical protein [Bacteroidota bacterium]